MEYLVITTLGSFALAMCISGRFKDSLPVGLMGFMVWPVVVAIAAKEIHNKIKGKKC